MSSLDSHLAVAVAAMAVYELLITTDQEVSLVWRRKFSLMSCLIIALRWTLWFSAIISMLPSALTKNCTKPMRLLAFISLSAHAISALVSAMRVWALGNRNYCLSAITLALGLILVVLEIYVLASPNRTVLIVGATETSCGAVKTLSQSDILRLTLVSRIALIAAELIVIIVTWKRTYKQYRMRTVGAHLSRSLFENGNAYFMVVTLANAIQCISPVHLQLARAGIFLNTPVVITIYRFIFDLRHAALRSSQASTTFFEEFAADISIPVFAPPPEPSDENVDYP